MKVAALLLALIVLVSPGAWSQTYPSYYSMSDLAFTSPGALKFGLYGFDNPALLTYLRQPDLQFEWTDAAGSGGDFNRWGLFTAGSNFGFGLVKTKVGPVSIMDYRIATGFGDRTVGIGLAYGFVGGDKSAFDRSNSFTLGALIRPSPIFPWGSSAPRRRREGRNEGIIDLAVRPLANELVALFADYGVQDNQKLKHGNWSFGAATELLPGIRFTGRYFDTHAFAVGISLSLGHAGFTGQSTWDRDSHHSFNTYAVRLGAYDRTFLTAFQRNSRNIEMNLNGAMKYQRFIFFDRSQTLQGTTRCD